MQRSSGFSTRSGASRQQGVALVIVLAFVVILTGVIVAYFTRALANRQISNSSANQTKVALFAQGASDSIIANLQEEIILSSTTSTVPIGTVPNNTVTSTVYFPTSPSAMLPQSPAPISPVTSWAPNFLIGSARNQNFYSGTKTIPGNASPVSTTLTSLNGRSVSLARWNSHYMLPLLTGSDSTPVSSGSNAFAAPDWVLVARDGSTPVVTNPTVPAGAASGIATWSSTNSSTVIGRYAYAIYHEGGMLDANVAGYPQPPVVPTVTSTNTQSPYKPVLAYADLTALGLTQEQVDRLVAWRNYASAQAPQPYSTLNQDPFANATTVTGSAYYNFVTNNPSGFLSISSTNLNNSVSAGKLTLMTGPNAQGDSDRLFGSRQELIAFVKNALGVSGTGLDVLNYLATFTRGIDQPSYSPDPTRPLITLSYANGGNNVNNGTSYELKDSAGYDPINPSFLSTRVTGTGGWKRNDGSTAIAGEPLVKTRFALSRLSWITYLGPSANRVIPTTNPGPSNPNYDMWLLVNKYGVSPSYLALGGSANVLKYFGLVWAQDTLPSARSGQAASFHDGEYKWFYQGHNTPSGSATPGDSTARNLTGSISRLGAIASLTGTTQREPDFFELLKAAVADGSIAKSSMNLNNLTTPNGISSAHPYYYQEKLDTNLDYAIIQLGANIIDEAKVDGYSTRIVFNDGTDLVHEFRGVQDLPYIYRVNSATLKLRMENPKATNGTDVAGTLIDPGVAAIAHVPTIWNPYDANAPLGTPGPVGLGAAAALVTATNFRLIADSQLPDSLVQILPNSGTTAAVGYTTFVASAYDTNQVQSKTSGISKLWTTGTAGSGSPINPTLGLTGTSSPIYPNNAQLTFVIPDATLFREPTVLGMPGFPSKSQLAMPVPPSAIVQYNSIQNQYGQPVYKNGGFLSDAPNPLNLQTAPPSSQPYIGIFAAVYPVEYATGTGASTLYRADYANLVALNGPGPYLNYRLQYRDPNTSPSAYSLKDGPSTADTATTAGGNWETYDEKYTQFNTIFLDTPFGANSGNLADQADKAQGGDWQSYADPRTSRFSCIDGRDLESPVSTPAETGEAVEFADSNTNDGVGPEEVTDRPDVNAGYAISSNRPPGGEAEIVLLAAAGWNISQVSSGHFRIGMLEQNSPFVKDNGIRFAGDGNYGTPGDGPQLTYYSDPDGVTRGAMGYYQQPQGLVPATNSVGLPLATAYAGGGSYNWLVSGTYQGQSRPYILHRPFRSVAELGYVFSGTPWKNIDFFTPQSGDSPMLDVFTAYEPPTQTTNSHPLVAGVVNLNTRQAPVLQAILSGAYTDDLMLSSGSNYNFNPFTSQQANLLLTDSSSATTLLARTASTAAGEGPLQNPGDLVGRWTSSLSSQNNPAAGFTGMSQDLGGYQGAPGIYGTAFSGANLQAMENIQRFRESLIRPLAAVGDTRVWNLLIDVIAQTGRYPQGTTNPANFIVDGEQRYWVHVAIDRYTGQVLDKQVEVVKE
jgi:hypothetical protein